LPIQVTLDAAMTTPMTRPATASEAPAPRPSWSGLGWRDLVVAAVAVPAGILLAAAFGVTDQLVAWSQALAVRLSVSALHELPAVIAIASSFIAAYGLCRLTSLRTSPLAQARIAERLRAALEQARAAEERAEASQRRLIEAIEMIPEGFALFDPEDRYVLWNSKYTELYAESADLVAVGTTFAEVLRRGAERGQYPAAAGGIEEWVAERLMLHANQSGAHEQQLPDGRWLRIAERRLHDGGSIGIRIDITELKRREESIRLLFEGNPVPMYVFDRETKRILEANTAMQEQYGYTREQFLAMSIDDIRPPDEVPRLDMALSARGVRFARLGRWRHLRADGSEIHVETMGHSLLYEGRSASIIAAVDITDQYRTEAALRQSEERLRQSEQHLAKAQRLAAIGSWEFDMRLRRFRWSEELYRIHKLTPTTSREVELETALALIHEGDRNLVRKAIERSAAGAEPTGFDFRIVRPDGEVRILHCEGEAVRDAENIVMTLIGTAQDVTATRNAERERRDLETQLIHAQRMDALGTLAGGIAHDLNNALVPILALSKRLRDQPDRPARDYGNLDLILSAAYRARDLVRQVLAFSRKEIAEKRPIDLGQLLRETMSILRASIPASISLEQRIEEVPLITGDPSQLHQVVINLVTNAAYAIGPSRGKIEVELRAGASCGEIELLVRDTGCGMDGETVRRIFDPFFTTKPVGEGTGLGLSVVHGIVVSHGGSIQVESEPGRGSSFVVALPCAADEDRRAAADPLRALALP
jgi:PAS domain S-box-containing protein